MMRRRVTAGLVVLSVVTLLGGAQPLLAQREDPLLKNSKDPRKIALQIRTALPLYEEGYRTLYATMEPESTETAVRSLLKSYRLLRAAYLSNDLILSVSKVPDPMLEIQNQQIMFVRNRLLDCTGHREYLTVTGPRRTKCLEGLATGLRYLRTVTATLP
jgi:hypothetical protein